MRRNQTGTCNERRVYTHTEQRSLQHVQKSFNRRGAVWPGWKRERYCRPQSNCNPRTLMVRRALLGSRDFHLCFGGWVLQFRLFIRYGRRRGTWNQQWENSQEMKWSSSNLCLIWCIIYFIYLFIFLSQICGRTILFYGFSTSFRYQGEAEVKKKKGAQGEEERNP